MIIFLRGQTNINIFKVFYNVVPGVLIVIFFKIILFMINSFFDVSVLVNSIFSSSLILICIFILEKRKNILGLKEILKFAIKEIK